MCSFIANINCNSYAPTLYNIMALNNGYCILMLMPFNNFPAEY